MREINVHQFAETLTSTFRRYLFTTNLISDSERQLRQAVWESLQEPNVFARDPLVTCIPAYQREASAAELLRGQPPPCLHPLLAKLDSKEFELARRLYEHQIEALEKAQRGRNLIVATGTGSGKTECFLLPALDDAARHPDDGVRAIVIYPMNALANDQLERLRLLLRQLPEITFGRYTGDTPEDRSNLSQEERSTIPPNERYSRQEIRQHPPHILLTNFAMLEYLLLRPGDADVFRQQRLRFVILDEAHTYTGSQGIDVALLMRRLRETFSDASLQFMLTSATLTEGKDLAARERIARFGYELTGGQFAPEDVILGAPVTSLADNSRDVALAQIIAAVPDEDTLEEWLKAVDDARQLRELIVRSGLPNHATATEQTDVAAMLFQLLHDWQPLRRIYETIKNAPRGIGELAKQLWGGDDEPTRRALEWLMVMGAYARADAESAPLLPVRFHFFFKGLNGATVCLHSACAARRPQSEAARWSRLFLEDRTRCEESCSKLLLPLSTCFQCGLPAVAAWVEERGKQWWALRPSTPTIQDNLKRVVMTWDNAVSEIADEDEEESLNDKAVFLCLDCGGFSQQQRLGGCCANSAIVELRLLNADEEGNLKSCPCCGTTSQPFQSVLREFRSGEDATTAVLAEAMMRRLPPNEKDADSLPAGGRRLLAFSDSRQRAAFFAPYLKRTTGESEYLKPLYDAVQQAEKLNDGEPATLEAIAKRFVKEAEGRSLVWLREADENDSDVIIYKCKKTRDLSRDDKQRLKRQAYLTLLQHFCASMRQRNMMPGLALATAEIELTAGNREDIPALLPEVFDGGAEQGFEFLQQLLQIFLLRRALHFADDSISITEIGRGPKAASFHRSKSGSVAGRQIYRWNPYNAEKQRRRVIQNSFAGNLVARFFKLDVEHDEKRIEAMLDKIWDCLRQQVLSEAQPGEYQLDVDERLVVKAKRQWFRCNQCGRLSAFSVQSICAAPKCSGQMRPQSEHEINDYFAQHHYRQRLTQLSPMALEVREHTAQLTNALGQKYQSQFKAGEINVLSSSTTFEMGVDVGQLKAVLLRNVPPTASNYIQRAGRAGRRLDGAAYAVTYCRQTPHEQYHFHKPTEIVGGKIALPLINLKNKRLAQRHVNSFLLALFLQSRRNNNEALTVKDFFLEPASEQSPAASFKDFVAAQGGDLRAAIRRILPPESELGVEESLQESCRQLHQPDNPDCVFLRDVKAELDAFQQQLEELMTQQQRAVGNDLAGIGRAQESVLKLIGQLKAERLIDFLAKSNWLPGYAFPQDVVKLLVRQPSWTDRLRLERDRERGISEYAPGSEVIADGHLFKSDAIRKRGQAFVVKQYQYCRNCRQLDVAHERSPLSSLCQCGETAWHKGGRFIEPAGFQTYYREAVREPNLFRMRPPSNTELFFIPDAAPERFEPHPAIDGLRCGYRRDGELFRANPGHHGDEHFHICQDCGRHLKHEKSKAGKKQRQTHDTPWGTKCNGTAIDIDLAHRFKTDTLQIRFAQQVFDPPEITDESFWLSFQTAFVTAAAEVLSIPRNDLGGTYRSQSFNSLQGELVIFDRVPGGAGYVERIIEELPTILKRTGERVGKCENPLCDSSGSCYACLRNYENQFRWDKLQRQCVSEWLEKVAR